MIKLTKPQNNAMQFISQFGPVTKADLLKAGQDMRAVNKLKEYGLIIIQTDSDRPLGGCTYISVEKAQKVLTEAKAQLAELKTADIVEPDPVPCPGEAHKPGNGMIDNCGLCAPEWGVLAKAPKKVSASPRKAKREPGLCKCGCKQTAPRNFVVGHDGQLHGRVSRVLKGKHNEVFEVETVEYLRSAKWMTEEKFTKLGID